MSGLVPAINYIKDGVNRAEDTKSAILFAVESNEKIKNKIKEIEEKAMKEIENQRLSAFDFDKFNIDDVPTIVLRDKEKEER